MAHVVFGMTMSLDGYINNSEGEIRALYSDFAALQESESMEEAIRTTGAVVMGRRTFEMAGDPDSYAKDYEFQVPIFIITSNPPAKWPKENEQVRFSFSDTIEKAIALAIEAAGPKNVTVVGGPSIGKQLLEKQLVNELQISIMPILLGRGQLLFQHVNVPAVTLHKTKIREIGQRTELYFDVSYQTKFS